METQPHTKPLEILGELISARFLENDIDNWTMEKRRERLIQEIESAFSGVQLDSSCSLALAMAHDSYPEADIDYVKSIDSGRDWASIPEPVLSDYPVLTFIDATAFPYYIPAFMAAALRDTSSRAADCTIWDLTNRICCKESVRDLSRYAELNEVQRLAVLHFLEYMRDEAWNEFSPKPIDRAIREYWSKAS